MKHDLPGFLVALQFMTRLRLPVVVAYSAQTQQESPRWYPAVGAIIGLVTGVLYWGAAVVFPPVLAAMVATAGGMILTGALHEDGFADLCDGLGGTRPKARALEIMRDSRIGTYGVLGLGMMVAAKVAALASLPVVTVPFVLIAGHATSRASLLWAMASSDYVRDTGAASGLTDGLDQRAMLTGLGTAGLTLIPLLFVLPVMALVLGLFGLALGHYAIRHRYEARLGGYTGDCLGAVQQCSEIGFYLGILALTAS